MTLYDIAFVCNGFSLLDHVNYMFSLPNSRCDAVVVKVTHKKASD